MAALIAAAILLPTITINHMWLISWFSMVSVFLVDTVIIAFICNSFYHIKQWQIHDLPFIDTRGLTIAYPIILFSFVAHPYLPRIEDGMDEPHRFRSVSKISFGLATVTKIIFGMAVACQYALKTKQKIAENIEEGVLQITLSSALAMAGFFSFPMSATVLMNIIQRADLSLVKKLFPKVQQEQTITWNEKYIDMGMRVILIAITAGVAIFLPEFSLLMAVLGSCTAVCLVIVFPVYFWCRLKPEQKNNCRDYSVILFGIVTGAIGLFNSIHALILAAIRDDGAA